MIYYKNAFHTKANNHKWWKNSFIPQYHYYILSLWQLINRQPFQLPLEVSSVAFRQCLTMIFELLVSKAYAVKIGHLFITGKNWEVFRLCSVALILKTGHKSHCRHRKGDQFEARERCCVHSLQQKLIIKQRFLFFLK